MPKLRTLRLLLALTLVVWLVPWIGQYQLPAIFGSAAAQWATVALTILGYGAGFFLGMQAWQALPAERRKIAGLLVAFGFIVVCTIGLYIVQIVALNDLERSVKRAEVLNGSRLQEILARDKNPATQLAIAQGIYSFSGSAVPYLDASGRTVTYQPTEDDKKRWELQQQSNAAEKEGLAAVQGQRTFYFLLIGLYLGGFVVSVGAGAVAVARKRKAGLLA